MYYYFVGNYYLLLLLYFTLFTNITFGLGGRRDGKKEGADERFWMDYLQLN